MKKGNKLISKFMDTKNTGMSIYKPSEYKYHTSYGWLMPVILKIADKTGYELIMSYNHSYWNKFGDDPLGTEFDGYGNIKGIYQAVISFIKWYNQKMVVSLSNIKI